MKPVEKTRAAGVGEPPTDQDVLRPEDMARMQEDRLESTPPDIIIEN